mgnify:CR=1 FL=1
MEQFTVQLNNAICTVCIGAGVLGRAGALLRQHVPQVRRWALAADEAVSAFYGEWVQGRTAGATVPDAPGRECQNAGGMVVPVPPDTGQRL